MDKINGKYLTLFTLISILVAIYLYMTRPVSEKHKPIESTQLTEDSISPVRLEAAVIKQIAEPDKPKIILPKSEVGQLKGTLK